MASIPVQVKKILDAYLKSLKDGNIPIKEAILFGSYANGTYRELSDIDIALVSDSFEGIRSKDRGKIRKITLSVSSNIEVFPYKPEDFTPNDPFVREVMRSGIKVA